MAFRLDEHIIQFPHPSLADEDGLLAVGGLLDPEWLQLAYAWGIFPWDTYNFDGEELPLWFAPAERFVIFPQKIHLSHTLKRLWKNPPYTFRVNTCFRRVMEHCAAIPRPGQESTWIKPQFIDAYTQMHEMGLAHSIEVFDGEELVGGLYGVQSGTVFCGESMFSLRPDTSKLALVYLCRNMPFTLVDCQFHTPHLERMGGERMPLSEYLVHLQHEY